MRDGPASSGVNRPGLALAVLVLLSFGAVASTAQSGPEGTPDDHARECSGSSPPCGYINPLLDLDFPDKPKCGIAIGDVDSSKCIAMLEDGTTLRFPGTVRWYWKESEDTIYPPDLQAPIVISFSGTAGNPGWLTFAVDPPTFTIGLVELLDQRNSKVDDSVSPPVVYYWFERPINVTFTRSGGPDPDKIAALAAHDSILDVYVRAKSSASGSTYNAGFGGEYFRFDGAGFVAGAAPAPTQTSPAGWLAPAAALAVITLLRRRQLA